MKQIALFVAALVVGCGRPAPTSAPDTSPAKADTPAGPMLEVDAKTLYDDHKDGGLAIAKYGQKTFRLRMKAEKVEAVRHYAEVTQSFPRPPMEIVTPKVLAQVPPELIAGKKNGEDVTFDVYIVHNVLSQIVVRSPALKKN